MRSLVLTSLYAAVFGYFIGAFYDVFRILRIVFGVSPSVSSSRFDRLYKKGIPDVFSKERGKVFSAIFVGVTDVIFLTLSGVAFILFLYCFNYGKFRWFILATAVLGFRLYYLTLGKAVIFSSCFISDTLKLVLNFAVFLICYPFRLFSRLAAAFWQKTVSPRINSIALTIDKCRSKRYTLKRMKEIDDLVDKWVGL